MGIHITHMNSVFNRSDGYADTVVNLAVQALQPILHNGMPKPFNNMVVATTCPDTLAPTLGQTINRHFYPQFENCHVMDIVQGCAGGVSALIIASQLSEFTKSHAILVLADAARQSVSEKNILRPFLGNGAFACVVQYEESNRRLIHHKTRQYKDLTELVKIKLGHSAHNEILANRDNVGEHPLNHLGLTMNPRLGTKLLRHAEQFYIDFIRECNAKPDILIFHQVHPNILDILKKVFSNHSHQFINVADRIGNCGAASYAIALDLAKDQLPGKKVFLCSFGTGGVISAGLWQF
jgi:3-oxoacyl-[acyl-carrier-protein] synthase III